MRRLRAHRRLLRGRVLQDARHLVTHLTLTLTLTLALALALALTLALALALTRTSCGHKTPSTGKAECNTAIIACLHACRGENVSQWCRDGLGIPISNRVLADAMHLVEGWFCGGPSGLGLGLGLGVGLGFATPHPNPNSKPNPNQVLWRALPQGR